MQRPLPLSTGDLSFSFARIFQRCGASYGDKSVQARIEFLNAREASLCEFNWRNFFLLDSTADISQITQRKFVGRVFCGRRHSSFQEYHFEERASATLGRA